MHISIDRASIPIANRKKENEEGFFKRIINFLPFACSGRNDEKYAYNSDEDLKEERRKARQSKMNRNRKEEIKNNNY